MMSRGYFGIGVYGSKWKSNIGTLLRSAHLFGADFVFTIGQRYKKQATDTPDVTKHTPLFQFSDWEDFEAHVPRGCEVVLIEQDDDTDTYLKDYKHPERAVYVLGAEDSGIPKEIMKGREVVQINTIASNQSMNVSSAGTVVLYDRFNKGRDFAQSQSTKQER